MKSNSNSGEESEGVALEFCETAASLHPQDRKHLIAAQGYAELGMFPDAEEEIGQIDPEVRDVPEALFLRLEIYRALEKWELVQSVVRKLRDLDPENSRWAILLALATRRAESIEAAKWILMDAFRSEDNEPLIPLILACYERQQGHVERSNALLKIAISLDSRLGVVAADDEHLRSLWESIGAL